MSSDWLFSATELQRSPSRLDGVSLASELERRASACRLVARLAAALHLSLASQRAACVFLHRFFMRRSLVEHEEHRVAAACLLLASKAENDETQGVDVQRLAKTLMTQTSLELSEADVASDILELEGDVLLALSFELHVDHSFCYIAAAVDKVVALKATQGDSLRQQLKQTAWSFLNDSAITWTCLAVDASLAAKAAVYAAGLFCNVSENTEEGPWWTVLETPVDILKDAARHVLSAYTAPFVDTTVLPHTLVTLVNVLHKEAESDSSEPLDDGFKVEIDAEFLVEEHPVSVETFVDQTTTWVDDCVVVMKGQQSPSSPSDPSDVEKSIPLYSPQNRAIESCTQGSQLLKRSITLSEYGHNFKKAKLAQ
ncbi:Cyclin N-terminal domain [Phytophthora infestans]|uniref:Cyclin N-terminal domain n=1 Tax=Phytophthora infestans TaxID=4787 RepID=A0A833RYS6_PHYIN|nr:Cyclin N-terminal domain [Phytophthora infestans]KAF4045973.1 Cyclin N-terminal domain [Phytophthora infestans]KAF4134512.1 Cyclin N-terminal domain-containing protein [Phytophthora infestans]KAI9984848.1 hypothetical protein PInf_006378 [Phytophthora infestans]